MDDKIPVDEEVVIEEVVPPLLIRALFDGSDEELTSSGNDDVFTEFLQVNGGDSIEVVKVEAAAVEVGVRAKAEDEAVLGGGGGGELRCLVADKKGSSLELKSDNP